MYTTALRSTPRALRWAAQASCSARELFCWRVVQLASCSALFCVERSGLAIRRGWVSEAGYAEISKLHSARGGPGYAGRCRSRRHCDGARSRRTLPRVASARCRAWRASAAGQIRSTRHRTVGKRGSWSARKGRWRLSGLQQDASKGWRRWWTRCAARCNLGLKDGQVEHEALLEAQLHRRVTHLQFTCITARNSASHTKLAL